MQPHQQRVIEEKTELDMRLGRLREFLGSERFAALDKDEQKRLLRQDRYMADYSQVLGERIEAFNK